MRSILAGIETEYGFTVEGRSVHDQIDDSMAFVRAFPGGGLSLWDYRYESPRHDLRGFDVKALAYDAIDARFDQGRARPPAAEERSDRVLTNGARFYNDHGHPEYATPECFSLRELMLHDLAGERLVLQAARAFADRIERDVRVYKNNTDYHGASYGTHESFLVPRTHSFGALYEAITPLLIARQVVCGVGKVGAEAKGPVRYQLSARADFMQEAYNLETLARRPVFNTRDEPHADPDKWIRLHVICGDANLIPSATRRKVGLVKIALHLLDAGMAPTWRIPDPAESFQLTSRDADGEGRIVLEGMNWTTPRQVLESYLDAFDQLDHGDEELEDVSRETRQLLEDRASRPDEFRRHVDWAAKRWLIDQFREAEGMSWFDPSLQSLDLAYHLLDREDGLYFGLVEAGEVEADMPLEDVLERETQSFELGRARLRGLAVEKFAPQIRSLTWSNITFSVGDDLVTVPLLPDLRYDPASLGVESVTDFIAAIRSANAAHETS